MSAALSTTAPAPVGTSENLQYQPPSGSKLVGGTVDVGLGADGYNSSGTGASGTAVLYEPAFQYDSSDVFFQCAWGLAKCANGTNDFTGGLSLPANRGGNFYIGAGCGGDAGYTCNAGGSNSAWAYVQLSSARFLLSSNASPQGSVFGGSALQRGARGTAHLVFTATDPGGPGVYSVTASIDGVPVWSGTPNTNGGACTAVGTDPSGALMFDSQQPCPVTEVVDVPVPTSGLSDGSHELTVAVGDAAQNSSTVLDQAISTSNPQITPVPRGGRAVHARFVISWSWNGARTLLRSIKVQRLPRGARVSVRCSGRRCPRLKVTSVRVRNIKKLLRGLDGKRFRAGNKLRITVSQPRHTAERIELLMRNNRIPRARLVKR
jgi:hypothetical protein